MKKKTLIKLGLTGIVLLGLGIWINSRWNAWFGNPEEPAYAPLDKPGRIMLTFGDADALSRNISWQYDSAVTQQAFVELADTARHDTVQIEAQGEIFQSRGGKAAYYSARLRSLRPDARYAYRVCNDGRYSVWHSFRTHNGATRDDYSFIYVGDVQDSIHGIANQLLKGALKRHPQTEFFVFGGDLTERPIDAFWQETFDGLDSIRQHYPILNVTGNHEYLKYVIRKLERRYSLVFSYYLDSMIGENQVYTLRYNDMQFFLLDSNREFFYLWIQRKWLKRELEKSDARWKIVVLHHPLYSIKGDYNNLIQRMMFNSLAQDYGADLILQGHEHSYARMTMHDAEGKATTPVYTVSHCSPKSYHVTFNERFDKFGISGRYYQYVRVHGDTLSVSAYDVPSGSLYDSLDIVKNQAGNAPRVLDHGADIPENLQFTPNPNRKKDMEYQERIDAYKQRKGIEP